VNQHKATKREVSFRNEHNK